MASVQELLLAAQAKQEESPLVGLARVLASSYDSYQKAQDLAAERQVKQLQIEEAKQKAEQRRQNSIELKNRLEGKKPVFQSDKVKEKFSYGEDGGLSRSIEFGGADANGVPVNVIPAIESGDLNALADYYKESGTVPMDVLRQGTANRSISGVQNRFDTSSASGERKANMKATSDLRDDFIKQSKTFTDMTDSYQRVIASAEDPSPAGDLALIFNYMKTLDPGSTVREGEFANAAASGSYGDRLAVAAKRIMSGERLSDDMRADFVNRAKILYERQEELQKQRESEFRRIGAGTGADVEKSIMKIGIPNQPNKINGSKIKVSNGSETLMIDPNDEADALRDGFKRVK